MTGMTPLEQLRAFVAWEQCHNPEKTHVAEWALHELERLYDESGQVERPTVENTLDAPSWDAYGQPDNLPAAAEDAYEWLKALRANTLRNGSYSPRKVTACMRQLKRHMRGTQDNSP